MSESDRYHVVNSYGAVGKYQVLKDNIPRWSKQVLGYSISWQTFRDNPALQEKIVRGILKGYYDAWGARGAAAAWYAGPGNHGADMSTRPQSGGPSIKEYVDHIMEMAGGAPAGGGGGSYGGIPTVTPTLSLSDMAARFGFTVDVLKHNREINNLVHQAVKEGWDGTLFDAHLKGTKWWKTTSDSQRKFFLMLYEDPATYKAKWGENQFSVNQLAVQVGLGNQINSKGRSTQILINGIMHKMRDGWSDAQLKAYFGSMVGMHGDQMYGEAGQNYDSLFQLAYANGMTYSKDWYTKNIRSIESGKSTLEDFEGQIRNQAAAKYSAFANQIKAGQNAMDLAQPYINSVSQILELPSSSIDLTNKYVNKAMTAKAAPGMQPGTQYPLWQFENDLRNDPLWKKTNNARESMFTVAHQVAKDFGLAF